MTLFSPIKSKFKVVTLPLWKIVLFLRYLHTRFELTVIVVAIFSLLLPESECLPLLQFQFLRLSLDVGSVRYFDVPTSF